jgi:hypothetical protein
VSRSVGEFKRTLLLWTSLCYGLLATAVPAALVAHRHLALTFGVSAGLAALVLLSEVLPDTGLGTRRCRLASGLLFAGPLGPVVLARRTRLWQPLLLVRPRPAPRR